MIVGTRNSELALAQTDIFITALRSVYPDVQAEIRGIVSSGDIDQTSPIDGLNGFGAFVRELDAALLDGSIDVSVNSMKDMPIDVPGGLCIPAVLRRGAAEDVMIPCGIGDLAHGALVGTSSLRRAAILKHMRPDIRTETLRGNVRTRLSKLDSGRYDAVILAKAGMDRLSVERKMCILSADEFVPAPAQGAIALVCRSGDRDTVRMLSALDDADTRTEVTIERKLMKMTGAGCSAPIGINASLDAGRVRLRAVSFGPGGKPVRIDAYVPADPDDGILEKMAATLRRGVM